MPSTARNLIAPSLQSRLIGSWYFADIDGIWEFLGDGTVERREAGGKSQTGQYRWLDDERITMMEPGHREQLIVRVVISGDEMKLLIENGPEAGGVAKFKRSAKR